MLAEIRALGGRPRRGSGFAEKEKSLAERLRWCKRNEKLSESQLAELEQMPMYTRPVDRMATMMQEIRDLGHLPRWGQENSLALRLKRGRDARELSDAQLAELEKMKRPKKHSKLSEAELAEVMQEIRDLGRLPRWANEASLAHRLRMAKASKNSVPHSWLSWSRCGNLTNG